MTGDDVDPEDPRPMGHYARFRNNEWHYVPDVLAQTISLGPAGDGEEGQDWVLTYTPERHDEKDREKVLVRLTPRALHELFIETNLTWLFGESTNENGGLLTYPLAETTPISPYTASSEKISTYSPIKPL